MEPHLEPMRLRDYDFTDTLAGNASADQAVD